MISNKQDRSDGGGDDELEHPQCIYDLAYGLLNRLCECDVRYDGCSGVQLTSDQHIDAMLL